MNKIPFHKFLPGIAWFFIVLVLICLPGKDIPGNSIFELLQFDKFAHTSIFGLMVILFIRPVAMSNMDKKQKLQYYLRIAVSVAIWGLATEFIQRNFVQGRNFDLWDVVADATGCTLAYFFSKKYLLV
ncbi:MAG: VanZ family protein [Rhizobacter sp.]|nr:VanZ family protein [Ferruginibacter sp.]